MPKKKYPPFSLDLFRIGYFILYKGGNDLFSKLIVKKQITAGFSPEDAQFTHVEVSGGGKHSVNISPPISKLVDITKRHKNRYICIVRYKNKDYERKGRYKVAYFSATLCNKGYDFMGILSFLFKWIKHSNRLYFCSEGCAWALEMEYPGALAWSSSKVMPAHFMGEEFELVWEGVIC